MSRYINPASSGQAAQHYNSCRAVQSTSAVSRWQPQLLSRESVCGLLAYSGYISFLPTPPSTWNSWPVIKADLLWSAKNRHIWATSFGTPTLPVENRHLLQRNVQKYFQVVEEHSYLSNAIHDLAESDPLACQQFQSIPAALRSP